MPGERFASVAATPQSLTAHAHESQEGVLAHMHGAERAQGGRPAGRSLVRSGRARTDAENVVVAEQDELLLVDGDLVPAILRQQHLIVGLHAHGEKRAVLIAPPWPDRKDDALVQLGLCALWEQHAADGLGRRFDALDLP